LMDFMGIEMDRVTFSWVSAAEGARWAEVVNDTVARVSELGPYISYKDMVKKSVEEEISND
ncbi:MAG: hydrogenase iron-sulfur subunit, partial [Chloroflexota bacterium]